MRIIYDDEEIKLKFCKSLYCKFEDFANFAVENLVADLKEAEKYCNKKWTYRDIFEKFICDWFNKFQDLNLTI